MLWTSSQDNAVMGAAPPTIAIFCPRFADTIAALSVSQKRYVPPASAMHFSSMAKSKRPPDVIRDPTCGANQFPGSSTTSDVVSKGSSPVNTFTLVALDSLGLSSTKRPYDPLFARIFSQ